MSLTLERFIRMSVNLSILGIAYIALGLFISYIFYYLFDEFDDEWKKKSAWFKIVDVCVEVALVVLCSYWVSQVIESLPPIVPIPIGVTREIEGYTADFFFVLALFLFLDELTAKLKFLQEAFFNKYFDAYFPEYGSIIDLSLSYEKRGSGSDSAK